MGIFIIQFVFQHQKITGCNTVDSCNCNKTGILNEQVIRGCLKQDCVFDKHLFLGLCFKAELLASCYILSLG